MSLKKNGLHLKKRYYCDFCGKKNINDLIVVGDKKLSIDFFPPVRHSRQAKETYVTHGL